MEVNLEQGVVHFFFNGVRQGSEGFALAQCEGAARITKARRRGPLPLSQSLSLRGAAMVG
jgi:hypothetical protein